jgi:DNA-binding transcriptional ArsR family regulator
MELNSMTTDRLSIIFAALADPTRRAILARLAEGDATVSELAEPFPISLPAISRHLKVLEHAGLISRSRSAQWRSSSLQAEPLREATAWMDRYRRFWDESFLRLDAHLQRIQAQARGPGPTPDSTTPDDSTTPAAHGAATDERTTS